MRYEYRVTKYDPSKRDFGGAYQVAEWTEFADVGRRFAGRVLKKPEYLAIERKYVIALVQFLAEAEVFHVEVRNLETAGLKKPAAKTWRRKRSLSLAEVSRFARLALRGQIWGRLTAPRRAYVHFGWDYYMYIGLSRPTPEAIAAARGAGLFVELFRSPYARAA
jgi:hypothetical protein